MATIESILREINKDLVPQFETKLREHLIHQDREWLIEQIVRLTLDAHSLSELDRKVRLEQKAASRRTRVVRLSNMGLNRNALVAFIEKYLPYNRERLVAEGYILPGAPEKGLELLSASDRTSKGEDLLLLAKDTLFGLLFGDHETNTDLARIQQELLTLTVPRGKVDALDFMKATTELSAYGTWQDPQSVSNDQHADNVLLEVEYGEISGELVGHGIVRALSLINSLEINEQVLYARMINVEETTLIT
jgi:hypothetical protein